jgi:hypothetical protein
MRRGKSGSIHGCGEKPLRLPGQRSHGALPYVVAVAGELAAHPLQEHLAVDAVGESRVVVSARDP